MQIDNLDNKKHKKKTWGVIISDNLKVKKQCVEEGNNKILGMMRKGVTYIKKKNVMLKLYNYKS